MTEIVFPLLGPLFVGLVVLPASAMLTKCALLVLERDAVGGPLRNLNLRYVLLVGSSVLPLAWFFSAGLHQAESGRSTLACIFEHHAASLCFEPHLFVLMLSLLVVAGSTSVLRKAHRARPSGSVDVKLLLRIHRILNSEPMLRALRGRIVLTDAPGFTLGTHDWLRPRIYVGTDFAARLSDEMLSSALGHEGVHVRSKDPLRYLLLELALAVNPLGRVLLAPHAVRWVSAREAHCDRDAVSRGSLPLPLADAIVQASRPNGSRLVALGTSDVGVLRFRVEMLLAFAERGPGACQQRLPVFPTTFALLVLALLLPHQTSTAALDAVHVGTEHALTYLLR